jgi:pimeloyl-ACP methyl ester carboxylesterase
METTGAKAGETRRIMSRTGWIGACLGLLLLAAAPSEAKRAGAEQPDPKLDIYLTPQTLATLPDGRRLHLFCLGQGQPVAIIAPGWHIPAIGWNRIQPLMAKQTRVCVYDRAGYSFSDPGPMPRDSAAEVKDLHDALKSADVPGPYILVGHSLGGFDARLFAYTYPRETAGLLLLDPPTERIFQGTRTPDEDMALMKRCADRARAAPLAWGVNDDCLDLRVVGARWSAGMKAKLLADQNHVSWFETLISEDVSMVTRSADELVAARHSLGAIPLIVLQADADCRAPSDAERCAELASQAHDSSRGERRVVSGASHMVQDDKPQVVLDAFSEIVRTARLGPAKVRAAFQ